MSHPPFQAIPDLPTFVGRQNDMKALLQLLSAGHHQTIYVLEGTAGVGKTALAARLVYRLRPSLPDGVLWARLDVSDVKSVLQLFAAAYGRDVSGYGDVGSRGQAVRQLLAQKRALVVLDHAQSSREVEPLLPPTGPCAVLVTTRRRHLGIARGAHHFFVEPFDVEEVLALFARVLGEEPVAREQAVFTEIGDFLGRLPLAVDIAACRLAYEPGWSAAKFLAHLRNESQRLDMLAYEERAVQAAFESSYTLLPPALQRFFAALGALAGEEFSPADAAAVTGTSTRETETYLRQLFCLCLVRRGRPSHYRLMPLLRSFAREKLHA